MSHTRVSPTNTLWRCAEQYWNQWQRVSEIWWTRQQGTAAIARMRAARLQALVRFARQYSPFYQQACHALPEQAIALEALPIVHKQELMANFNRWVTDPAIDLDTVQQFMEDPQQIGELYLGRYGVWKSSGSTGEPGIFVQDMKTLATYDALLAVQLNHPDQSAHYLLGCVNQYGRAALVAATGQHFATIATWVRLARTHPWLDTRVFSINQPLPQLVAALNAYQPAFLSSYPTLLVLLAQEKKAGRLRIYPNLLWSGGEHLTAATHATIEDAFNCPLISEYGASECMSIAFSCTEGWLHVNHDWLILEPVDHDGRAVPAGTLSDTVLLTNLANHVQPLLRYDLGDRVLMRPEPCRCGNVLPAIQVEGRRDEILQFKAQDGRMVSILPIGLTTVVEEESGLHHFQIVQITASQLVLRIRQDESDHQRRGIAACRAMQRYLAHLSLPHIQVNVDRQEPFPDRSGKLRQVITHDGEPLESDHCMY